MRCSFVIPGDWLTPTGGYRYDRRIVLALQQAGVHVDHAALPDGFPMPDVAALEAARRCFEALEDGTVVVVDGLAFGVLAPVMAPHARRLALVALVHHPLHLETGLEPASSARLRAAEVESLRLARRVIVTSASTLQDVLALGVGEDRIDVVEPGVDRGRACDEHVPGDESIHAAMHGPADGSGAPLPIRLLCVASLVPRKGHAVLLEALAGLLDMPWTLDLVGSESRDAAMGASLRALAASLRLDDRVVWHGAMDEAGVARRYAECDVFVLPSFYEGYGMVVTEALAAGLPVVTTTGGALAHTLPKEAGLHVPPGDVPALREALRRVMADAGLRATLAAGARRVAASLPTWEQSAARFACVLAAVEVADRDLGRAVAGTPGGRAP